MNQPSTNRQASERALNPKKERVDLHSRLKQYETEQSKKKARKPSGYAYRALKLYDQATCFMCGKLLYSPQSFADHVRNCTPEDKLYSIVPKELVLGLGKDEGGSDHVQNCTPEGKDEDGSGDDDNK